MPMAVGRNEIAASRAAGFSVSTTVLEGDPRRELGQRVEGCCTTRRRGEGHAGLSHLVLGSVRHYASTQAQCLVGPEG
jgi:hypothetical protein